MVVIDVKLVTRETLEAAMMFNPFNAPALYTEFVGRLIVKFAAL